MAIPTNGNGGSSLLTREVIRAGIDSRGLLTREGFDRMQARSGESPSQAAESERMLALIKRIPTEFMRRHQHEHLSTILRAYFDDLEGQREHALVQVRDLKELWRAADDKSYLLYRECCALHDEVAAMKKKARTFPVMLSAEARDNPHYDGAPRTVPLDFMLEKAAQVSANHAGQSVADLAARGGLSWLELLAVAKGVSAFDPGIRRLRPLEVVAELKTIIAAWTRRREAAEAERKEKKA